MRSGARNVDRVDVAEIILVPASALHEDRTVLEIGLMMVCRMSVRR